MGSSQLPTFSLQEFLLDELKLCGQIILVREMDRKTGLLSGLWLLLCFFWIFGSLLFLQHKREVPTTRNRTRALRMSSFTTVLRSTKWAIGRCTGVLSDRFVRSSDSLWSFHVSSQQHFLLLFSNRFFSWWYFLLFGILYFSFPKSDFCGDANSNLGPTDIFIQ